MTWRLSAKIFVPTVSNAEVPVATQTIAATTTVPAEKVAVVGTTPAIPQSAADVLRRITPDLESNDATKRNSAGRELMPLLENAATVEQVVRGIPNGTPQYKEAVTKALAKAKKLPDAKTAKDILSVAVSKETDNKLRNGLLLAITQHCPAIKEDQIRGAPFRSCQR
jgi:hypothetical protein